jgi:hypothetical protein
MKLVKMKKCFYKAVVDHINRLFIGIDIAEYNFQAVAIIVPVDRFLVR